MENKAHCLVCKRVSSSQENFLCGDCVSVDSVIITCECGRRYKLEPNDPSVAELSKELHIPIAAGTAIKATNCQNCGNSKNAQMDVYRIKRADA